jgi:hypothetical protein
MGRPAGWMHKLTGREAMRLLGAPSHRRVTERRFWEQIAIVEVPGHIRPLQTSRAFLFSKAAPEPECSRMRIHEKFLSCSSTKITQAPMFVRNLCRFSTARPLIRKLQPRAAP